MLDDAAALVDLATGKLPAAPKRIPHGTAEHQHPIAAARERPDDRRLGCAKCRSARSSHVQQVGPGAPAAGFSEVLHAKRIGHPNRGQKPASPRRVTAQSPSRGSYFPRKNSDIALTDELPSRQPSAFTVGHPCGKSSKWLRLRLFPEEVASFPRAAASRLPHRRCPKGRRRAHHRLQAGRQKESDRPAAGYDATRSRRGDSPV